MKKTLALIIFMLFALSFIGCAGGLSVKPVNPFEPPPADKPCTIYQDLGVTSGLVYTKIKNPCAARNILIMVAQEGVVLEAYKIDQFHEWSKTAQAYIQSGITANDLKVYIMAQVMKLNKQAGMTLFVVSGMIDIFEGNELLDPGDVKVTVAALQDLDKQVEKLRPWFPNFFSLMRFEGGGV